MIELKKKLNRVKRLKFTRNVLVGVIALILAEIIVNVAPGYKRDKYVDVVNLIINEENYTEYLKNDIYISDNNTVYISQDDIKELFDSNIYFDTKYNQIITTSYDKVASIAVNSKKITINYETYDIEEEILKINQEIYIPISILKDIYNIDVNYVESSNYVVIDDLDKGMIKGTVVQDVEMNFKPRTLSKKVGTLQKGEEVYCFYTTSKGWRQIRTSSGLIAYIKANMIENETIIRQDVEKNNTAKIISLNETSQEFKYINEEGEEKSWQNIDIKNANTNIVQILSNYKTRTEIIDSFINILEQNGIDGINIKLDGLENEEIYFRFLIEFVPKLRSKGITTCISIDKNSDYDKYLNIVDYITKE